MRLCRRAFSPTLARRRMIFRFAAARAALLPAAGFLVHGCPRPAFGFALRRAALLVTFLDVLGLAFLLVRVTRLVASWHDGASDQCGSRLFSLAARWRSDMHGERPTSFHNARIHDWGT